MEKSNICEQCGAPHSDALPGGQCPKCLLKRGLGELESVDSPPVELAETFVPEELPAADSASNGELHPGAQFGDYEIVRRLGSGGMGTVYEANQLTTGRRVALKVLSHSLDSKEARSRFLREGRLAASINHPNSVYVFGTEEINGIPTISMELIDGGTLASEVQKFGAMSVTDAVDAILQVLDGLEAAERKGVLHRDIKPSNCFVDASGEVKVGDYGLSISTMPTDINPATMTQEGTFLGTPAFASPEQLRGEQLDQRSDIYSVGVTLYYLLTGRAPFEGKNLVQLLATVLDNEAVAVNVDRPDVPQQLSNIVHACMSKSSGSRPASYAELRELLRPFSSETSKPATIGQRCLAGILDYLVVAILISITSTIGVAAGLMDWWTASWWPHFAQLAVVSLTYFSGCEAWHGKTIGKRLVGLRVTEAGLVPSAFAAGSRAMCYVAVGMVAVGVEQAVSLFAMDIMSQHGGGVWTMLLTYSRYVGYFGILWLFWPTIRRQEHARHDTLTGTRVVRMLDALTQANVETKPDTFDTADVTRTIGPYHVLETLAVDGATSLHLAFDTKLLRRVWLRTYPDGTEELPPQDRRLARIGRLRWLGGQRETGENRDCYEAPSGHALVDHERDWEFDRQAIVSLANELKHACADGTLPARLSPANLWIHQSQIKLLPFAAPNEITEEVTEAECIETGVSPADQEHACATFVALVAKHLVRDSPTVLPIRARTALAKMSESKSLEHSRALATDMTEGLARVSRGRRLLLLFVTFVIPLVTTLNAFFWQGMRSVTSDSRLQEMSGAFSQIQQAEAANYDDEIRRAWKVYLAGAYREAYEDTSVWSSFSSRFQLRREARRGIAEVMENTNPSPTELAAAKVSLETLLKTSTAPHYSDGMTIDDFMHKQYGAAPQFYFGYALTSAWNWLLWIWLPGMVATFFGGGLFQRALGVAFADETGKQLTGLRALWRAFLPGVPLFVAVLVVLTQHRPFLWTGWFTAAALGLFAAAAIRNRFISDTLSRCYLVPR